MILENVSARIWCLNIRGCGMVNHAYIFAEISLFHWWFSSCKRSEVYLMLISFIMNVIKILVMAGEADVARGGRGGRVHIMK